VITQSDILRAKAFELSLQIATSKAAGSRQQLRKKLVKKLRKCQT
jgi:hypothetical protein